MANDLPDWVHNTSLAGQTISLGIATANSSTTLILPTRASAVVVDVLTTNFSEVRISGRDSGEVYVDKTGTIPTGSIPALVTNNRDTAVIIFVAHPLVQVDTVDVSFMPNAMIALMAAGSVFQEGANPPLWQSPRNYASAELSAVSSGAVVAGTAAQVVRLFGWNIEIDQAAAATVGWLEDDSTAVGAVAGRLAAVSSAGNGGWSGNEGGKPLTSGAGIRLNVPLLGAGGIVRAQVGYSKG